MTDPLIEAAPLGSSDLWPEEHHLVLVLGMLVICRVVRLATYVVLVSPLMKHTALVAVISLGGEQTVAVAPQWILVFELLGSKALAEMSPPLFRIVFSAAPQFMLAISTASSATPPEASRRSC